MSSEYQDRIDKVHHLRKQQIEPYPTSVRRTHTVQAVLDTFDQLTVDQVVVSIVGRVRSIRRHGKSTFGDLEDQSGSIQWYAKADVLDASGYQLIEQALDEADFLEVAGTATLTKRGEKTILVSSAQMLSKAVRPLPSQWYGFKDVEDRYRKRYIDLLLNPEVRHRFDLRSRMISAIRRYFDSRGFTEVSTPTLQPIYGG
ncbi:lysine--tRNA ligase, partial [Candidatus Uhrbacteria bacterium]|nr:lysine--tRNA ligase [Candidatus Uhrbacteria bacterium]